jgi:hypothetical protein
MARAMKNPPRTFDVTQVIGTVSLDPHGTDNVHLVAFRIIAEHDSPGTFTFPNMFGAETTVTVGVPPTEETDPLDDDRR